MIAVAVWWTDRATKASMRREGQKPYRSCSLSTDPLHRGFSFGAVRPQTGAQDVPRSHVTCGPVRMDLPYTNKPGDSGGGGLTAPGETGMPQVKWCAPGHNSPALIREKRATNGGRFTGGLVLWVE